MYAGHVFNQRTQLIIEPTLFDSHHGNPNVIEYAPSEDSDQLDQCVAVC